MTRTSGNDASLDGFADESHIANHIQQLVAGTFILPNQRLVLDISQFCGISVLHAQHVSQHVQTFLCSLALVDDNGIVHVATLDEVGLQQGFDVANEDKGASSCYLSRKLLDIVERSKLRIDNLRIEGAHGSQRELIVGKNGDARTGLVVLHLNLLADDVPVFGCILFLDTYLLDFLNILDG